MQKNLPIRKLWVVWLVLLCLVNMVYGRDFSQQTQLTASDAVSNDSFGYALAVDGDTAIVGALGHDVEGVSDQGAAYVYVDSGDSWTEQAQLISSEGNAGGVFGWSVAISGDTALVGAPFDASGGNPSQGAVYVFVRSGDSWTEQAQLIASDGAAGDFFGWAVAVDGDTALVGAVFSQAGGIPAQGTGYVFTRSGDTWTEQTQLFADDAAAGDSLGWAVALSGSTALLGAPGVNGSQGAAYTFVESGGVWTQQEKLTGFDGLLPGDRFGAAVAIDGTHAVVGAPNADIEGVSDIGAAYYFNWDGDSWFGAAKSSQHLGAEGDNYGTSVAIDGLTAAVGSPSRDVEGVENQGSAHIVILQDGLWTAYDILFADDGEAGDTFGFSVGVSADKVLVGATGFDLSEDGGEGGVYVLGDPGILPTATFTPTATPTATNTPTPSSTPTATSTPDVTETPTATDEPGSTELIANGDFEGSNAAPWTIKNASGDKVKCNKDKDGDGVPDKIVAQTGTCAFQFKDVAGEAGKLEQTLDLSGIIPAVGDGLNLSFFAQGKSGATVKAKVVFKYADDTKTKISVESSGADVYTEFTGSETLTSADITKAKISFKSAQTAGKVYVDSVSLQHSAGAGFIPLPNAQLGSSKQ